MGDMTGIFRDLAEIRRERKLATHKFGVYKIGSRGKALKTPDATAVTEEEAREMAERMMTYNPGHTYVVKAL